MSDLISPWLYLECLSFDDDLLSVGRNCRQRVHQPFEVTSCSLKVHLNILVLFFTPFDVHYQDMKGSSL